MKCNPMLWSTLRRPFRSLLFLLVIAVASFAFVARAVEYLVVDQETERLEGYYRPIGYLEPDSMDDRIFSSMVTVQAWWLQDVTQGISTVSGSPYVDWVDQRRYCSGILQGMQNSDLDESSSDSSLRRWGSRLKGVGLAPIGLHITDVILCGTLVSKGEMNQLEPLSVPPAFEDPGDWYQHEFLLQVDRVEAGYGEYVQERARVPLLYYTQNVEEMQALYADIREGTRYLVKAQADPGIDFLAWMKGEQKTLKLKALDGQNLYFYPVEPGETINWSDPALKGLQKEVEVLRENQSAVAVIGVKDMSALPRVQEKMEDYHLADGRWLNQEDDATGRRVCVVHQNFAALRGLSVGDTLTLKLRDLKAPLSASLSTAGYSGIDQSKDRTLIQEAYILEGTEDWAHWREYPTQTETFQIVGLYGTGMDSSNAIPYTSSTLNLYIPNSCMPEGYGQETQVHMDSYSFRLRSAEDTQAFLQEVEGPLADLGLQVHLIDKGWENFAASAKPIQRAAVLNAGVFSVVLALVLVLFAFLFLRQKRGEFAIQRALGVPRGAAVRRMLIPVTLLGIVGILIGGIPAWGYALGKAGETLATLQTAEGVEVAATLSAGWLLGLCGVALALLVGLTAIGALRMARRPVLTLLQGEAARTGATRR